MGIRESHVTIFLQFNASFFSRYLVQTPIYTFQYYRLYV